MRITSRGTAFLLALGLVGCGARSTSESLNVTRDSAGVRIVESFADARFDAPWIIGDGATLSIGAVEGDPGYLLSLVEGAMKLPTGEIVIANRGSNELRFYDRQGALVRTMGGTGQGPGEFEYLRALGRCRPDGFVAFDIDWQMNAYTADGSFVDKTMFRAPDRISPYNLACDPDGHFVILGWGRETREPRDGFYQARDHLLLVDEDGEVETDFGERLVSERIGSRYGSRPHPAGRATVFDMHDEVVYVGSGERFEVELRDLEGSLLALLRGPRIPLEVTDSLKSAYLEVALARTRPERRPALRQAVTGWGWPERVPAFTDLRVDPEGVAKLPLDREGR